MQGHNVVPIGRAKSAPQRFGPYREPLLTRKQLAEQLSVTERSIKRWEKEGLQRAIQAPIRYELSEAERFLNSR